MNSEKFGKIVGHIIATTIILCICTLCIALTCKFIAWMF